MLLNSRNSLSTDFDNTYLENTLGLVESDIAITKNNEDMFSNFHTLDDIDLIVLDNDKLTSASKTTKRKLYTASKRLLYPFSSVGNFRGMLSKIDEFYQLLSPIKFKVVNIDALITESDNELRLLNSDEQKESLKDLDKESYEISTFLATTIEENRNKWLKELKGKIDQNVTNVQFKYIKDDNIVKITWDKSSIIPGSEYEYKIEVWELSRLPTNKVAAYKISDTGMDLNAGGLKDKPLIIRIIPLQVDMHKNQIGTFEYDNDFIRCYTILINDKNTVDENKRFIEIRKVGYDKYSVKNLLVPSIDINNIKNIEIECNGISKSSNSHKVTFDKYELFNRFVTDSKTVERLFKVKFFTHNGNQVFESYEAKVKMTNPFFTDENRIEIHDVNFSNIREQKNEESVDYTENTCDFGLRIDPVNKILNIKDLKVEVSNDEVVETSLIFEITNSFNNKIFHRAINLKEFFTKSQSNIKLNIFETNSQRVKDFEYMKLGTRIVNRFSDGLVKERILYKFSGLIKYWIFEGSPYLTYFLENNIKGDLGYYFYIYGYDPANHYLKICNMNSNQSVYVSDNVQLTLIDNEINYFFVKTHFIPERKLDKTKKWVINYYNRYTNLLITNDVLNLE